MIENLVKERLDSLNRQYSNTDVFILSRRVRELAVIYTDSTFREIVEAIIPEEETAL